MVDIKTLFERLNNAEIRTPEEASKVASDIAELDKLGIFKDSNVTASVTIWPAEGREPGTLTGYVRALNVNMSVPSALGVFPIANHNMPVTFTIETGEFLPPSPMFGITTDSNWYASGYHVKLTLTRGGK